MGAWETRTEPFPSECIRYFSKPCTGVKSEASEKHWGQPMPNRSSSRCRRLPRPSPSGYSSSAIPCLQRSEEPKGQTTRVSQPQRSKHGNGEGQTHEVAPTLPDELTVFRFATWNMNRHPVRRFQLLLPCPLVPPGGDCPNESPRARRPLAMGIVEGIRSPRSRMEPSQGEDPWQDQSRHFASSL